MSDLPDKAQVREAIPVVAMALQQGGVQGCDEFRAGGLVLAVARAFVDGSLLPAKPDYEAAEERLRIKQRIAAGRYPLDDGDARDIVDAALAGKQETGREEQ